MLGLEGDVEVDALLGGLELDLPDDGGGRAPECRIKCASSAMLVVPVNHQDSCAPAAPIHIPQLKSSSTGNDDQPERFWH